MPGSLADHGHRWEHPGFCPRGTKFINLAANRTSSQDQDRCPLALNYVTRGAAEHPSGLGSLSLQDPGSWKDGTGSANIRQT